MYQLFGDRTQQQKRARKLNFYVFLIELYFASSPRSADDLMSHRSRTARRSWTLMEIRSLGAGVRRHCWRGGVKINNFSSQSNVIFNKLIASRIFLFFLSLILKPFAHRTKIHKCFFLLLRFSSCCCKKRQRNSLLDFFFFSRLQLGFAWIIVRKLSPDSQNSHRK